MADHFLSKITIAPEDLVEADGRPVLERYAELKRLLADRAGPEAAALFAEPLVSRGNDAAPPTVSWYAENSGDPVPLGNLAAADRDRAETWLTEHLRPLRSLVQDPETAELAMGALSVYGRDDIVVVADRPVIVNWGLMPDGKGANAGARPGHYEATLGRFLPLAGRQEPAEPVIAATVPQAGPAKATGQVATPARRRGAVPPIAWVPLVVLLLLTGAVLAWLLMPGTRLFHPDGNPPIITEQATHEAAQALNQSLRERKAALETALEGAVCRADGVLLLPDGRTPEGLLPPPEGTSLPEKAEAAPDAMLPGAPGRVVIPGDGNGEGETLLDLIEARTVLVLAAGSGRKGMTGSGFVVGPGLIVTNHHVVAVAGAEDGRILVAGAGLDKPRRARILKTTGPLAETGTDLALLQADGVDLPAFALHRPEGSLKLSNVIAAGYPSDVLEIDAGFEAMTSGQAGAMPSLTLTDGIVNTEQKLSPRTNILMHSAPLSSGNSGGPLVDLCGRVVGVNSFVRQGEMQNRGFALATADLLDFLEGTDAAPEVTQAACAPVIRNPQPASAAPDAEKDAGGE